MTRRANAAPGNPDPVSLEPAPAVPSVEPATGAPKSFWYKDAIIYELHVRAFLDTNGDGIGDFPGLTQKLDYLQELGVTALWLLPFYPSPLKDDGYDIADYYSIHPLYGTLKDFRRFLDEAHRRDLRVITELVVNHTSDQHPWFQRSRRARPGSAWREFYVWSDSPEKYKEARIIFRDFEMSNWTWDPLAQAHFWHRFYSHQPDLNYDSPQVHKEILRVLDFWLEMGVDGLRLDAVPYLYEREGTSCENLPETHGFLKELRRHVDSKFEDRLLLAEANQWPEQAVTYFGSGTGDECHMAFHFPLMPRLFMAVRMEDRVPIVDILEQTPPIPETSQWALFLRNHDELTLEMVTDEERDYMYRVYAGDAKARINLGIRRRLAPLLGNDRKRIELLHLLLLSLPGTPVLYYGDEIGMGDNVFLGDRNGVRTPMQWNSDRNAGFSRANPHALYLPIIVDPEYHYEAINVEAQQRNPNSLFWWTKRVLTLRQRHHAFGRGTLEFVRPDNRKILAFVRSYQGESILVVANLSRFPQPVLLDLARFEGSVPLEVFGGTAFPEIAAQPYPLTLSPHACFWFVLTPAPSPETAVTSGRTEILVVNENWEQVLEEGERPALETELIRYIQARRWFGAGGRQIQSVQIRDSIPVPIDSHRALLLVLQVEFVEGDPEEYLLPVSMTTGEAARNLEQHLPDLAVTRLRMAAKGDEGLVFDALGDMDFCRALLEAIARRRTWEGSTGLLKAAGTSGVRVIFKDNGALKPRLLGAEHSNSALVYGHRYFLKLFRRLEPGINPELEVGRFLTERRFPNAPAVGGAIEYFRPQGECSTVGILTEFFPHAQDTWDYMLDMLSRYFDRVRTLSGESALRPWVEGSLLELSETSVPEPEAALIGTPLELARLLGQRTGELHVALSSDPDNRDFAPELFTPFYQRSLFQSMRNAAIYHLNLLRRSLGQLPEASRADAEAVLAAQDDIVKRFRRVCETAMAAKRMRCHGDLHLGQVLFTGKDFIVIDFEGNAARPLGERRIKRSPLVDAAGMIRSFDYITQAALFRQLELGTVQSQDLGRWEPWAGFWSRWVSSVYLRAYLEVVGPTGLLPPTRDKLSVLLESFILDRALFEVGSELKRRPAWMKIPVRAILQVVRGNVGTVDRRAP
jgi:maltose alpha-D-glucosyltransferase / alpha-amylase